VASLAVLARGRALSAVELRRREPKGEPDGWPSSVHPVLQQVYAARGVLNPTEVEHRLARMLSPQTLGGMPEAVDMLLEAIRADWSILIAGDYDCDGATGTAVAIRGLRLLGARNVRYAIPNRFVHGYGLSPALVDSLQPTPQLIVTVDNGVASIAGVSAAKARGIRVIVTDHHLPGDVLPDVDAMVNPNLVGDPFPSKALAGVGVMFYLLLALRARLYSGELVGSDSRELSKKIPRPDLSCLLDLVALGTVADLVPLDPGRGRTAANSHGSGLRWHHCADRIGQAQPHHVVFQRSRVCGGASPECGRSDGGHGARCRVPADR
jgi:single-stranded-DNA-specific exonuclease